LECKCLSLRICNSFILSCEAPAGSIVRHLICWKHSGHASRPQVRHIHEQQKIEVKQVSSRQFCQYQKGTE
jgi:hypothetical protein